MAFESDKIMFEIYKDKLYNEKYRVVYYTELNEHNKHSEITRAMNGNSYFNGFINDYRKNEAKLIIDKIVSDLNEGSTPTKDDIKEMLLEFTPKS